MRAGEAYRNPVYEMSPTPHNQSATVGRRLITAMELAVYIGSTQGEVYQMVSRRQVPFVKIGRSTRFDINAIDEWIRQRSVDVYELKG